MSSAAATLVDFDWQAPEVDYCISPDGIPWQVDFKEQNFEGMIREVLEHSFQLTL